MSDERRKNVGSQASVKRVFEQFLSKVTNYKTAGDIGKNQLLHSQITILQDIYLELIRFDFYSEIKNSSNNPGLAKRDNRIYRESRLAVLHYNMFLNVLNRLGRILKEKYGADLKSFPRYYKIRLYRNKVIEHWDDYLSLAKAGMNATKFKQGKAPIPIVEKVTIPRDREEIREKINEELELLNKDIEIPKKYTDLSGVSVMAEYADEIYGILEVIRKLRDVKKDFVNFLFNFGFPAPVTDVENYLEELFQYLEVEVLKARK